MSARGPGLTEGITSLPDFEGVIHEATSISPRDAPTKLDDEDVAGDEDSGVAMATSEFQDVCSSDSRGNSKQASDSAVDDGKSSTLAWYEIEEDENDIETEVDDFTPKKAARNGLTEEWIKFGHFQLKGKHHELTRTGGNEASDKEDDTVLYDWESFTEEDDEITLAYDWEAFENSSDQGFHQDKIFRYSFEDKKVVPNVPRQYVQPVVNQSYHARELNRHNGEQRTNGFSEAVPSGTNNSQHSTDQDHTLKRRELYRKISSDILDKLSRRTMNEHLEPTETHKSTVLCDQKHRLCTCSHNDRVADVRATTSAHSRKEDKNNNSKPRSKHWQSSRIITNGSLECRPGNIKRKSQEREYGKTETVRAAGGKLDTSRGHRRSASDHQILERRPHQTAQRKLRKGDDATMKSNKRRTTDTYFAESDFKLPAAPIDACLHSCSLSNIAGDRRPLFYDIEKALDSETTELPKCECTAIRKERTTVKFSHQFDDHLTGNTIGQYDSSDQVYDFTASLEAGYCEDNDAQETYLGSGRFLSALR
ncbi:uncharacterized protein [Ptychodera flava]|uniref:uncharacterized protein n=1 Tax=Ptychodera flava TaxID=63121 RepID=UPI00396A7993